MWRNLAYDAFLHIFTELYNKHCPIRNYRVKDSYKGKPWMTKSLQKACKKKNLLYKRHLQLRTSENEKKYKQYKNTLISIMRRQKKECYNKFLEDSKNNIQKTWKVINHIIRNSHKKSEYPSYFLNGSGDKVNGLQNIVEEFKNYFVGAGSNLASKISMVDKNLNILDNLIKDNKNSLFLVIEIVRKLKNKSSTDIHYIDMIIIKEVIDFIVGPLTYIFNLSFQKGVFPTSIKQER